MDAANPLDLLAQYEARPAQRSGPTLLCMRERFRQALAIARLEGYAPTNEDLRLTELVASGRVSPEEARSLCLKLPVTSIPTSSLEAPV